MSVCNIKNNNRTLLYPSTYQMFIPASTGVVGEREVANLGGIYVHLLRTMNILLLLF